MPDVRIPETLPQEVLTKMYAPAKPDYPLIDADKLTEFDAFLFGIREWQYSVFLYIFSTIYSTATRYGNFPAQWKVCLSIPLFARSALIYALIKVFWDTTGGLWAKGALAGKYVSVFFSTASLGGGQESTAMNAMSTFVHHGMIFVPLGYSVAFPQLTSLSEIRGGVWLRF